MEFIPFYLFVIYGFVFGVIIGSFLNVYLYRFHTGKSLAGGSHCLSCTTPLRWFDLFPLISYLVLRGRCRCCGARIPSRYFWVELITGLLFVAVISTSSSVLLWPINLFLMSVLIVVAVYDFYHFVIPDEFVYTLSALAIILAGLEWYNTHDWMSLAWSALATLLAFSFFASLWAYSKGRWLGFGDAKLAIPLGFMVGIGGVFSMLVLAFWIGTIISIGIIAGQKIAIRGQLHLRFMATPLTIKSEVPFAPFLILGFLAVYLFDIDVLQLFAYVF